MEDIVFQTKEGNFSSRLAGILMHHGKILLQKDTEDIYYSVPGCFVRYGETSEETLVRTFEECVGLRISVNDLKWVTEAFYSAEEGFCHQICLYYDVALTDDGEHAISEEGFFEAKQQEGVKGKRQYHWIKLEDLDRIEGYPENIGDLIENYHSGIKHFIFRG